MKEDLKFKFAHHTAIYHGGGKYTLIADDGYLMQSGNTQAEQVETKDYTKWTAIEASEDDAEKEAEKNRKASATLCTIFEMAHDMGKIADGDERMEAVEKKMTEQFPACEVEQNMPPIDAVLTIIREAGLEPIVDAFDKAWAGEDPTPVIEAMPDAPDAEAPNLTETADGEGENTETEAPAEEEAPAEDKTRTEAPAEEEAPAEVPAKPAKTKKAKAE